MALIFCVIVSLLPFITSVCSTFPPDDGSIASIMTTSPSPSHAPVAQIELLQTSSTFTLSSLMPGSTDMPTELYHRSAPSSQVTRAAHAPSFNKWIFMGFLLFFFAIMATCSICSNYGQERKAEVAQQEGQEVAYEVDEDIYKYYFTFFTFDPELFPAFKKWVGTNHDDSGYDLVEKGECSLPEVTFSPLEKPFTTPIDILSPLVPAIIITEEVKEMDVTEAAPFQRTAATSDGSIAGRSQCRRLCAAIASQKSAIKRTAAGTANVGEGLFANTFRYMSSSTVGSLAKANGESKVGLGRVQAVVSSESSQEESVTEEACTASARVDAFLK